MQKEAPSQQRKKNIPQASPYFAENVANMAATWHPNRAQIEPKSQKKRSENRLNFGLLCGSVFFPILVDFRKQNGGKLAAKFDQKGVSTSKSRFVQKPAKTIGKSSFLKVLRVEKS